MTVEQKKDKQKKYEATPDEPVDDVMVEPPKHREVSAVIVHPLVMLSVVDHFNRVYNATKAKRVVGILLGNYAPDNEVNITNCFGLPFEEEDNAAEGVWFLDTEYLLNMFRLFRKVNARETLVGWYHSGPNLYSIDVKINAAIKRFVKPPVLLVIRMKQGEIGSPLNAYVEVEEVKEDGSTTEKTFALRPCRIESEGAEEIGVEHLLRDVKDRVGRTLAQRVTSRLNGLKGMSSILFQIAEYLDKVADGQLPANNVILYHLQDVLNLLPNLDSTEWLGGFLECNNENMMGVFICSITRSVLGLHDLIDNKMAMRDAEKDLDRHMRRQAIKAGSNPTEEKKGAS